MVIPFVGSIPTTAYSMPGNVLVHLNRGEYTVYEHTSTRSGLGGLHLGNATAITIHAEQVTVTAPDTSFVPVSDDKNNDTLTQGSGVYSATVEPAAPISGEYSIVFATKATTVLIAKSLRSAFKRALPWFVAGVIGGALVVTGGILLIVGGTRRSRGWRAMYLPWGYPPYGYQPPWGPPPTDPPAGSQ